MPLINTLSKPLFLENNMKTRIWKKKYTQEVIRELRKAGYQVDRLDAGYQCEFEGNVIFAAMKGSSGYLVRHHPKLFSEAI